ncbi:MAG: InlB B-repeat-containing protein [Chloroflexi bacterium]|nr:InlB B-repeat-containing protein [Chloroflexota bacterium]
MNACLALLVFVLAASTFMAATAGCEGPRASGERAAPTGAEATGPEPARQQPDSQRGQRPVSSATMTVGRGDTPQPVDSQPVQTPVSSGVAVEASPTPTATPSETPPRTPAAHGAVIIAHETIVTTPIPLVTPSPRAPGSGSAPATDTAYYSLIIESTNPHYGDITISPYSPSNRYPKNAAVTISVAPKPGHEFQGWRGNAAGKVTTITVVMDGDKTIHAGFSRKSFKLTVAPALRGGVISISPNLRSYDYGSTILVDARPQQGYLFKSWTGDASGTQNPMPVVVEQDMNIGAVFEKGVFNLQTKVNPRGFIDSSSPGVPQESGARVTLTARPPDNHRFVSWTGDVSSNSPAITITMDSNKSVTANFVRIYTLSTFVNPPGYGTVTPASGIYDEGEEVTLTASPSGSSIEFVEWAGNVTGSNTTVKITMNSDKSASAYFQPIKYPFQ